MSIDELSKLPEIVHTPFPYRGKKDFRGFDQDDYDHFSAGLFQSVDHPGKLKWFGGREKYLIAKAKLESLGYKISVEVPGIKELGNETDGYSKVKQPWYRILFESGE